MRAENQPGLPSSPIEYSELWGLYHINDNVFHLIENIETIVREHMNTAMATTYATGCDLRSLIKDAVFAYQPILDVWEDIAEGIPLKYEKYSLDCWVHFQSNLLFFFVGIIG